MDQRRFILFIALSMSILMFWSGVVMPRLFPQPKKPAAEVVDDEGKADAGPAIAEIPGQPLPEANPAGKPDAAEPKAAVSELKKSPHDDMIVLGSLDPASGYFMEARLTTEGAAVRSIKLNDPRYRELHHRDQPLPMVTEVPVPAAALANGLGVFRTMQMSVSPLDRDLKELKTSLDQIDWEVDPKSRKPDNVEFRFVSPDGRFEIAKRFHLKKYPAPKGGSADEARDHESKGYQLQLDITVRNLSDAKHSVAYTLQGPVGVPLENIDNTRKFRDLRMGFLTPEGQLKDASKTAAQVVKDEANEKSEEWMSAIRYLGVDIQYFAALMAPLEDQTKGNYVSISRPQVLSVAKEEEQSQISVLITSQNLEIPPGESVTHQWALFAGPKRESLLDPLDAGSIVDFGFASAIARGMLWLLKFFHDKFGLPWGLAIVALTVVVRGCMFPISRKQAIGAKKMKDLQPKIAELKKKHGDDKEKFARAQMELFSKHNYNPLAGCLPVFLQLPIFIGLYNSLNSAVELRMASFLYIDNLAAPDALFKFPFKLPFLGSDFNLLPIITIFLFIAQQKMFMPPPTDEQQAAQQKMMNFMMVFMGFMFYTVPAGLCIYFIASSMWGMAERKVLDMTTPQSSNDASSDDGPRPPDDKRPPRENFWTKMLAQADAAGNQAGLSKSSRENEVRGGTGSDRNRKDKRKR